MPATTYLQSDEYLMPTGHAVVDKVLQELRAASGGDWRVARRKIASGHSWWPRTLDCFTLYVAQGPPSIAIGLGEEFQVINFYRDDSDWSINHDVPAELVIAYMYGACRRTSMCDPQ